MITKEEQHMGYNEIFEDDVYDDNTEENIIYNMEMQNRLDVLQKENNMLSQQNLELRQQLQDSQATTRKINLELQKIRITKTPAYKDNINKEELIKLHNKSLSMNKIAEILKCDPKTVKSRLKELGLL